MELNLRITRYEKIKINNNPVIIFYILKLNQYTFKIRFARFGRANDYNYYGADYTTA